MATEEVPFSRFFPALNEVLADEKAVVVGGLPTDGILTPGVLFCASERRIVIPDNAPEIPAERGNGSMRDVDVMAFTGDQTITAEIQAALTQSLQALGQRALIPEVSVSGYTSPEELDQMLWLQFVSQTIRTPDSVVLRAGHITVGMPPKAFEEPWRMSFGRSDKAPSISVFAPPIHIGRYETRSLTGTRPKDRAKVNAMHDVLSRSTLPSSVRELAEPFDKFAARVKAELTFPEALRRGDPHIATIALGVSALRYFEQQQWIVDAVQGGRGPIAWFAKRGLSQDDRTYGSTSV